ncbi:hypothetical protein OPQ81_005347 [Rhizoctonia solani]|nr:hypothetical protein OPQ81_005347 [Rhizoctonia solani]
MSLMQSNELTYVHMASAEPIMGKTKTLAAPKPADRSTLGHRSSNAGQGIPGAFAQSPTPQEPELSLDEQEEDWVSDAITEAARERINKVQGDLDKLNPLEVSEEEDGEYPTNSEPSKVVSKPAKRLDELHSACRPASVGPAYSRYSQKPTGSMGRKDTPVTPSFLAEAEATAHPGAQSMTLFQMPRCIR